MSHHESNFAVIPAQAGIHDSRVYIFMQRTITVGEICGDNPSRL